MTDTNYLPLEDLRNERGLTRAEVAAHFDMSERHLYRLEKGKQPLSRIQALAFAEFYGVALVVPEAAA